MSNDDTRVSTAFLSQQRDDIDYHSASGNYDPVGEEDSTQETEPDPEPKTDKSMSAIALTSNLSGSAGSTVGDWVQKHGWNKGTTLHIAGYNVKGNEMTVYGPNKDKSVTVGGGSSKFADGVTDGQRSVWSEKMSLYNQSDDAGSSGRSPLEYVNDLLSNSEWKFTREDGLLSTTSTTIPEEERESHGEAVTGEDAKQPGESTRITESDKIDPGNAEPGDPVPDGGLTTGSSDSSDSGFSDGWDYPDAVDTELEKKAWRDAGGEYAKAQRLITKRKNSGGGSGDDSGGEKSKEKSEDGDEAGLTTGGGGSQSDDSDSSDSGDSGQSDSGGIDRKTAAIGAGAVGLVAAKHAGVI